ncbi:hypothetical protein B0T18DRAFT_462323 [Schizothecium vesticola]|uniref:DUF2306 domain-containing protein n=1 Tax=Schizothecium vesticola TaxID=314040 RepID=A0AA40F386_9PEZI|nr:hypothetical protein B0T18DRAFT_462323 [Schizothecium vesticola]
MAKTSTPGRFYGLLRALYVPLGFRTRRSFFFFLIFAGALVVFSLIRLPLLFYSTVLCGPSPHFDCYYFDHFPAAQAGIRLHLGAILPAGILAALQFVPALQFKWAAVHRINGYIVIFLSAVGTVGAMMIARWSMGGGPDVQAGVVVLGIGFLVSLGLAWWNARVLQFEEHRKWMLRAWAYAGCIVTARFALVVSAAVISQQGYYAPIACERLASRYILGSEELVLARFPECAGYFSGANQNLIVAVEGDVGDMGGLGRAGFQAALLLTFGVSVYLSFLAHVVGVEVYIRLTPGENERLRTISYHRQVKAGFHNPGRAGLTADRLGDSSFFWAPREQKSK